jgi:hypothetical protein
MQPNATSAEKTTFELRAALLDYCQKPGKYQVSLRQPALLFASLREVLQLAVGREEAKLSPGTSLRDAARFFVRTGLLYPGAGHYALLGLERSVENAELKDRYRLLMRLLHPDYAGPDSGAWPPDAAVRVNRAYDMLSSPVQRRDYDERLAPGVAAPGAQQSEPRRPVMAAPKAAQDPGETRQAYFKKLAFACALAGAALVVVGIFASGTSEPVHLVQRSPGRDVAMQTAPQAPTQLAQATSSFAPPALARLNPEPDAPAPPKAREPIAPAPLRPLSPLAVAKPASPPTPSASPSPAPTRQPVVAAASPQVDTAPRPAQAQANRVDARASALVWLARANPRPVADEATVTAVQAVASPPPPAPAPQIRPTLQPQPMPIEIRSDPPPVPLQVAAVRAAATPLKPSPTLNDAQPLISQLLQLMEGGRGDRILNLLDAEARSKPSAQALSRQYDSLVDGARPVRLSHVEFKAEPGDGRLLVVGQFRLLVGEQSIGALGKKMVLRAEFVSREGNVVITGLSGGAAN